MVPRLSPYCGRYFLFNFWVVGTLFRLNHGSMGGSHLEKLSRGPTLAYYSYLTEIASLCVDYLFHWADLSRKLPFSKPSIIVVYWSSADAAGRAICGIFHNFSSPFPNSTDQYPSKALQLFLIFNSLWSSWYWTRPPYICLQTEILLELSRKLSSLFKLGKHNPIYFMLWQFILQKSHYCTTIGWPFWGSTSHTVDNFYASTTNHFELRVWVAGLINLSPSLKSSERVLRTSPSPKAT